ncbi:MAG: ABC transporter substrate-binding protein [Alphaproteobacteria bacterium]|nr:ABC transporter substrate-binding protein [Alphaproteobacteria bacterium]
MGLAGAAHAQAPAATPQRGGTLIFSIVAESPTFDCHATDSATVIFSAAPFYSTLLKFDLARYPEIVGDLAESWTVSPDGLTYSFRLRDAIVFHDGTALTSADVKASYERIRRPAPGLISARSAVYADIDSIDAPDPRSIVFRLRRPNPSMLQYFASPWNCIYSAARLAQDPNWPAANIMGTGPFRLGEYVAGSHFTGTRFDRYFMPGRPYVDAIRAVFMGGAAMVNSLQGGQIHIDSRGVSPAQRDRLVQAMGDRVRVVEGNMLLGFLITFNSQRPPFDDARVRRALNIAIDRRGSASALRRASLLRDAGGILRPGAQFAATDAELDALPGFSRDIRAAREEARALLREAGRSNLTFQLVNRNIADPYTPAGVFLLDQWRQIGVTVEHRQIEPSAYLAAIESGNFDVALDFQSLFMDEPTLALEKYLSSDRSPQSRWRGTDRTLDSLYERQEQARDAAERRTLLRQFERRVFEQANVVPFMWWSRIVAMNAAVQGFHSAPSYLLGQDWADVWLQR